MLSAIQSDLFLVVQGHERLGRVPAERGLTTYVVPHCHATLTELWPMPPHRMSLYPRSESVSAAAIREGLAVDGRRRVLSPWRVSPRDVTANMSRDAAPAGDATRKQVLLMDETW